jgi:hypothetical protein
MIVEPKGPLQSSRTVFSFDPASANVGWAKFVFAHADYVNMQMSD